MPTFADAKLEKITLNLYEADARFLRAQFGEGYSVRIRKIVHDYVNQFKAENPTNAD